MLIPFPKSKPTGDGVHTLQHDLLPPEQLELI